MMWCAPAAQINYVLAGVSCFPYSQVILCAGSEAIEDRRAHTDTPGQLDGRDGRLLDLRATSPEVVATERLVPAVSIRNERGRPKAPSSR